MQEEEKPLYMVLLRAEEFEKNYLKKKNSSYYINCVNKLKIKVIRTNKNNMLYLYVSFINAF